MVPSTDEYRPGVGLEDGPARVLLKASNGVGNGAIAAALDVAMATVGRVPWTFVERGLDAAVERRPQPPRRIKRILVGDAEARLTMPDCSMPPDGHDDWTLHMLADRMVGLNYCRAMFCDTVNRHFRKVGSSRGGRTGG